MSKHGQIDCFFLAVWSFSHFCMNKQWSRASSFASPPRKSEERIEIINNTDAEFHNVLLLLECAVTFHISGNEYIIYGSSHKFCGISIKKVSNICPSFSCKKETRKNRTRVCTLVWTSKGTSYWRVCSIRWWPYTALFDLQPCNWPCG